MGSLSHGDFMQDTQLCASVSSLIERGESITTITLGSLDELKDSLGYTVTLRSLSLKQYLMAKPKVNGKTLACHSQDSGLFFSP